MFMGFWAFWGSLGVLGDHCGVFEGQIFRELSGCFWVSGYFGGHWVF